MRDIDIFQQALGLTPPWQVVESKFDAANNRLDLYFQLPLLYKTHFAPD